MPKSVCGGLFFFLTVFAFPYQCTVGVAADDYALDPTHTSVHFKISHLGLSWTYGRFDSVSGHFKIDAEQPENTAFELKIDVKTIDTNNQKRDEHLRSPDFFNVKQFPSLTFKSTTVRATKEGYEVTGDLTMHGVTKPVTFILVGGRKAEFPPGTQRTGFSTELVIKRSDFGMDKMIKAVGDKVYLEVSFEGTSK